MDQPLERTRPIDRVVSSLRQVGGCGRREHQRNAPFGKTVPQPGQLDLHDFGQVIARERVEHHRFVHSVQELGAEVPPEFGHHHVPHFVVWHPPLLRLQDLLAPQVRGHDQHRVLKIHRPPL